MGMTVKKLKEILKLKEHPEGGFYAETFRDMNVVLPTSALPSDFKVQRPVSTAIYFLIPTGSVSRLHRMPAAEVWHFYDGDPLTVFELRDTGSIKLTVLGRDLEGGHVPQHVVPPRTWFGSFPTLDLTKASADGDTLIRSSSRDPELCYSLVGCTVSPGFEFNDFELAKRSELVPQHPQASAFIKYLTADD